MQPFAERVLTNQLLKLGDQFTVPAEREVCLDAPLQGREPLLLQPCDLGLRERLERQVGQSRPAPQTERLPKHRSGILGPCLRQRTLPPFEQPLEPVGVELARRHAQPVARRGAHHHRVIAERLAQPRHMHLNSSNRGWRSIVPPQRRDKTLGADRLIRMKQQTRQHRARLTAP